MLLKDFEALPSYMQSKEVKYYYDLLKKKTFSLICKRIFDIIVTLLVGIIALPICLVIAILIRIDSKGAILYKQERITQFGRKFKIYKFRTMVENADKIGTLITTKQDARITSVGKKLRKYRLDELPQLINILKGDMSIIGARPEVQKYVDAYSNEMMATLLLPAGVSGLSSIKFKDEDEILEKHKELSTHDAYIQYVLPPKMEYNYAYLKQFNIWIDIKLCIQTVWAVLFD